MRKNIIIIFFMSMLLAACAQDNPPVPDEQPDLAEQAESEGLTQNDSEEQLEEEQSDEETTADLSPLTVHFIDVGQADATLFQFTDKKEQFVILYDVGDWQGNEVVPFLKNEGITAIDLIIISHPHADHIGQLEDVINEFAVGEVWMSGNVAT